jgi:hypothetical protein
MNPTTSPPPFALLPRALLSVLFLGLSLSSHYGPGPATAHAVTIYSQQPLGGTATSTSSGATASFTGAAAFDPTVLNAPAVPDPLPSMAFGIQLQSSTDGMAGLSIKQDGGFMGFSVEFSVINQVCTLPPIFFPLLLSPSRHKCIFSNALFLCALPYMCEMLIGSDTVGKNSSLLQVPFLNLMSNIRQRGGFVRVRVGGNSQETATLVGSLTDGKILEKDEQGLTNPVRIIVLFTASCSQLTFIFL